MVFQHPLIIPITPSRLIRLIALAALHDRVRDSCLFFPSGTLGLNPITIPGT
jgi:hypothetical protein